MSKWFKITWNAKSHVGPSNPALYINTNILIPKGQIIPALGLCPLVSMIPQSAEYYKIRYISLGLKGKNKSIDKEAIL